MKNPAPTIPKKRSATAMMIINAFLDIRDPPPNGYTNLENTEKKMT
jgi:hypothetical protein